MTQSEFQRKFSQTEFAAGSVRGIRAWRVARTLSRDELMVAIYGGLGVGGFMPQNDIGRIEGQLIGQYSHEWTPGENVATCQRRENVWNGHTWADQKAQECSGIEPDCTCGFYAYWGLEHVEMNSEIEIVGVVESWGKVTMGVKGYRAAKSKILAIAPTVDRLGQVRREVRDVLPKIRERYPDVAVFDSVQTMLAEFPPTEAPEIDEPEPKLTEGAMLRAVSGMRPRPTGPHLQVQWWPSPHLNTSPFLRYLADDPTPNAAAKPTADDTPDPIGDLIKARKNRNTGPKRNPFKRRGAGQ